MTYSLLKANDGRQLWVGDAANVVTFDVRTATADDAPGERQCLFTLEPALALTTAQDLLELRRRRTIVLKLGQRESDRTDTDNPPILVTVASKKDVPAQHLLFLKPDEAIELAIALVARSSYLLRLKHT